MRDPLERIISAYIHDWTQRRVQGNIAKALQGSNTYEARSAYAYQIEPYLRTFGPERILPVFLERLVREPEPELRRICRFIGDPSAETVRWAEGIPPANVSRHRFRKGTLFRFMILIEVGLRSRCTAEVTKGGAVWRFFPPRIRRAVKSRAQIRVRPRIPAALRQEIAKRLDEDLGRLGHWLGRELSCDGWKEQVLVAPSEWTSAARLRS